MTDTYSYDAWGNVTHLYDHRVLDRNLQWGDGVLKRHKRTLIALLVLWLCLDGDCSFASRRASTGGDLLQVALYSTGEGTGHIAVDIEKRTVSSLSPSLREGPELGLLRSGISKDEKAELRRLVASSAELRCFNPRSSWFGTCNIPDIGSVLVLTWTDRTRAYAIPPDYLRRNLPKSAKDSYAHIDSIVAAIIRTMSSHKKPHNIVAVPVRDPRVSEFQRKLRDVFAASLPVRRKGW